MDRNGESGILENPNDALNIPEWIKEDLFYEVLKIDFPEYSKIVQFSPVAAIGPGENYTSTMLRVHIDVELKDDSTESISYIVKTALENEDSRKIFDSLSLFPKEREMYVSILPKFVEMYANAGKTIQFGPCCKYVHSSKEHVTIIMEDLKQRNFSNKDRLEGLDLAHITSSLKKLAEFHAASAVYFEQIGPFSSNLVDSWITTENRPIYRGICKELDTLFNEVVSKFPDHEKYESIWPTPDKIYDWMLKAVIPDPAEFNVLNHGDCWSNNIMFQHNDQGQVTETLFVDYQITHWCSLALDVLYLITSSAHYDVRVQEFDGLIAIYHENLAENLKLLEYSKQIPSLKDIHMMMIKYSTWALYVATSVMSVVLVDPDKDASFDNWIGKHKDGENFRKQVLLNPRYMRAMEQLIPWGKNRGVFDF